MAHDLIVIERELDRGYMPAFANILTQTPSVPALAFKAGFMEELRRNPTLMECTHQSLFNCGATAAFTGLMPGGPTGQMFFLPFRDTKRNVVNAVPVVGYRGYNTIAARSKIDIEGGVIRKDDKYRIIEGTKPDLIIERNLDHSDAQIIASWSVLHREGHRYSQRVLGIKQLMGIKAKSMGARKADSPWNDHVGPGFEAMCEKSARRRQARSIPLNAFVMADAMETTHDLGKPAWIIPREADGHPALVTPEGEQKPPPPEKTEVVLPPKGLKFVAFDGPDPKKHKREFKDIGDWLTFMLRTTRAIKNPKDLDRFRKAHASIMKELEDAGFDSEVHEIIDLFNERG